MTHLSRGCNRGCVLRNIWWKLFDPHGSGPVADKLTQQITDALTRAAAEPGGLALYASKSDPGLFPNTASAKPAAQKCLADTLVRVVATETKGKTPRDLYGLTEKGWEFLLAAVNPKQVLEDFVRVLEARQGEVGELLASARSMAESLQGLKEAVARVLPNVSAAKLPANPDRQVGGETSDRPTLLRVHQDDFAAPGPATPDLDTPDLAVGVRLEPALALLDAPPALDLAPAIVAFLTDRAAATDCPLPELFRAVAGGGPVTIGEFHDCLRQLYADGAVTLPAWTGPLYALPEPQYALLIGHGIAYYASLREAGIRRQGTGDRKDGGSVFTVS